MRVLAVGAHPDDLEILCGGTLARFAREGHEVVMCHATTGDKGSFVHTSEEVSRIRVAEARRAAGLCGAEHATLSFADGEVNAADAGQQRAVVELVRDVRPDVILTHSPGDYHSDHNEISKLVFDCSFHATLPLYATGKPHHEKVVPIFFIETVAGIGFSPTEYVDISGVIDVKTAMLEAHESQLTWLRDHDGVDIVEQLRVWSRFRGIQCGVAYAEGFVPCRAWLRGVPGRLLP